MKRLSKSSWIILGSVLHLWATVGASGQKNAQLKLPEGEGKAVFERMCSNCHEIETVTSPRLTEERWANVVDDMIAFGAEGTDEEIDIVIDYLAGNFGRDKAPTSSSKSALRKLNVNTATAKELAVALQLSAEQAKAIVRHREKNGYFKNWQDLKKISVLEGKEIAGKKDLLTF